MHVHFIGIGGIGISSLARFYLEKGWEVSGSDLEDSEMIESLKKQGAEIYVGSHKAKYLTADVKQVVYSSAVRPDNPELKKAKKLGLKIQSYPQALGELTKKYFTIAVSGTHGKSTTVAMISLVLIKAGFDPTCILGTKLREFGNSNFRQGQSKYLVIEADEWQASFLNFRPKIIVLTNIEKEHLDYYKNLNHILQTYKKYIKKLPKTGLLIANSDDENICQIVKENRKLPVIFYSLRQKEVKKLKKIIKIPGIHNISNALSSLAIARTLKIPDKTSFKALSEYKGAWRRFEIKKYQIQNTRYKIPVINDYAHHPTEIKATLKAVREKFKKRKIWAIFQPHQYQRTYYLFKDFVSAFGLADEIILTDIYTVAGREEGQISKKVSAKKLAAEIKKRGKKVHFIRHFEKIPQFLKKRVKSKDTILIMGAGSIYKLVDYF